MVVSEWFGLLLVKAVMVDSVCCVSVFLLIVLEEPHRTNRSFRAHVAPAFCPKWFGSRDFCGVSIVCPQEATGTISDKPQLPCLTEFLCCV